MMSSVIAFGVWMRGLPLFARWVGTGVVSGGVIGGIAGLIVGLFVYAPTAWFAAAELGFPAALAGGIGGAIMAAVRRLRRSAAKPL